MVVAETATGRQNMTEAPEAGETSSLRLHPLSTDRGFAEVFRSSVAEGMGRVLGPGGAQAILYHLNLPNFGDPDLVHEKLTSIFGVGTASLERVILQQLNKSVGFRQAPSKDFDFLDGVERAKGAFEIAKLDREH